MQDFINELSDLYNEIYFNTIYDETTNTKYNIAKEILKETEKTLLAFSGGFKNEISC